MANAHAETNTPELSWSAPTDCPAQPEVERRVRTALADSRSAVTRAYGRVTHDESGFTLQLALDEAGSRRERTVQAASCDELVETMIWLLVVSGEAREPTPTPMSPAAVERARFPYLLLAGGVWSNALPAPQGLMLAALGLGVGAFEVELRYGHAFARERSFAPSGTVALRSDLITAAGCWSLRRGRFAAGPCATISGARVVADVRGITRPVGGSALEFGAGLSARGKVALREHLALLAEAGAGLPLVARPRFSVMGDGVVARASLVSAYGLLALIASW